MENNNGKKTVMLVAFYNVKALGVRYLESALKAGGYDVVTVFFKGFNSANPQKCTNEELELLCSLIREHKPLFVGLSVMSSMYLDTVNDMISKLKAEFDIPLVTGGAFATLFPEYFLDRGVDFSTRADGERVTLKLANALKNNTPYEDILSLCYKKDGKNVINPIGDIAENIDEYGIPAVECMCAYSIEHNVLSKGDPQLSTLSYEVIASRGCPFTCSYCSVINLHRLMPNGTKAVRTRSVDSVIAELIEAKKKCKKLVFVHFYDEIFPNTPGWVDEFCEKYNKNIRIPFTIWSHPKMVDGEVLKKLRRVGLMEVIMGIQSGSDYIRKEIFHRYETREDIIKATNIIKDSKIFWASYDFMLQHPFETIDTLKETYYLVKD
ncbi:MAG: B12-binding domain-containing radical SAM protein, partial [Clostridia bacterium]|nr:B12-binding domain-containing radical SAM protein [Clostridia bacterium]